MICHPSSDGNTTAVLLIGHGSSSHPTAAACLARYAAVLRERGDFVDVGHATLTGGPDPEVAFADLANADRVLVLPYFITDGYLSHRATSCGLGKYRHDPGIIRCRPIGQAVGIIPLIADIGEEIRAENGWQAGNWDILLVAHGSPKDPASRRGAKRIAKNLTGCTSSRDISTCFIDEAPFVGHVAKELNRPTAVLGLFAAPGGHALDDVPNALHGVTVPVAYSGAIGEDTRMTDVIAAALDAALNAARK